MSKVIDSFLVSIGFDVDEGSAKDSQQSIDNIRGSALQMGAALSAALIGSGFVAKNTAKEMAGINNQAMLLGNVGVSQLHKFQKVFELAGESAQDANATFSKFESLISDAKMGKGPFEMLQHAGIPQSLLTDTKTSIALFEKLAKIMPNLNPTKQKHVVDAFGLNAGAQVLLKGGQSKLNEYLARADQTGIFTPEMAENSKELTEAATELGHAWEGLRFVFSSGVSDGMTEATQDLTEVLIEWQKAAKWLSELLGENIKATSLVSTAVAGGGAASLLGATASKVGLTGTGKVLGAAGRLTGGVGMAGTAGYLLGEHAVNPAVDAAVKRLTDSDSLGSLVYDRASSGVPVSPGMMGGAGGWMPAINVHKMDVNVNGSHDAEKTAEKTIEKIGESFKALERSERTAEAG